MSRKVAVVTGGARGLGRAIAERLAADDYALVLLDVDEERLTATVRELEERGSECCGFVADVASEDDVSRACAEALERLSRVNVLVNNAGVGSAEVTLTMTLDQWNAVLGTHLTGTFLCSKTFGAAMTERGGAIVNVSSIMGFRFLPSRAAYASAKAGMIAFTKATAVEWARYGIRVNAVAPGYVATEMVQAGIERGTHVAAPILARTPLGRMAEPQEIADAVAYLVSPEAAFVTGHVLVIDGGYSAFGAWWDADALPPGLPPG